MNAEQAAFKDVDYTSLILKDNQPGYYAVRAESPIPLFNSYSRISLLIATYISYASFPICGFHNLPPNCLRLFETSCFDICDLAEKCR